jgi:hypothetical protein
MADPTNTIWRAGEQRLYGRDLPLKQALTALVRREPRPFVRLTGQCGVGRTAFIAALCNALPPDRPVLLIRGDAALQGVSLGALAPVLAQLRGTSRDESAIVRLHRELSRSQPIVIVDDADLLDPATAGVIEQIVRGGTTPVLISVAGARRGHDAPVTTADAGLARGATLAIDLPPLKDADLEAVVKDQLGSGVNELAVAEIVRLSAGSTKLLSELIEASIGAGSLHEAGGEWQFEWPYVSPGVLAALPANPFEAPDRATDLMALLAVAGDLPVEQAGTSGVSERGTRLAEDLGFVTTLVRDGRIWVSLAHPLFAPAMLATVSPMRRVGYCLAGADMLDGLREHRVRRVLLQLRAEQHVDPSELISLARAELRAQRYTTAMTLGEHAVREAAGDPRLRAGGEYVQAQAMSQVGRVAEATARFESAWAIVSSCGSAVDEEFLAQLAQAEGNHLAFRAMRPDLAVTRVETILTRIADPARRAFVEPDLVKWRLMAGQGLPERIEELPALQSVETASDLNLLIMTAMIHTMGGNLGKHRLAA